MKDSPVRAALLREGAIAAQLIGSGITTLRRAASARPGLLVSAFFNLSIGLERIGKLVVVMDHYVASRWKFPDDSKLRGLHHDLEAVFAAVREISTRRFHSSLQSPVPNDPIHQAILFTLSEFARITRYQNLDYLANGKGAAKTNPETQWFEMVGQLILKKHYRSKQAEFDEHRADVMHTWLGGKSTALSLGPNGKFMRTVKQTALHAQQADFIQRYAQFYSLQLVRFFAETLAALQQLAHYAKRDEIPWFSEQFAFFLNDDAYFKSRKTWIL
jgi:hypothetical protein